MFNMRGFFRRGGGSLKSRISELRFEFITLPRSAWQRARRGWSEWDIVGPGFTETHTKYLGHSLIYLASIARGAPAGYGYNNNVPRWDDHSKTDFDGWKRDLIKHGNALIMCGEEDDVLPLALDPTYVYNLFDRIIEERREAGRQAFLWLAENYQSLWD